MRNQPVITVRYPSGAVEYRYGGELPKKGDKLGRNGDEGFVTSVDVGEGGHATVRVGTRVSPHITWNDATGAQDDGKDRARARERILEAAYDLFSQRGIRAVSIEDLLEQAVVSRATFYRQFRTKDDLVLAFLQRREHRWTGDFVEAEARRRGSTPRGRLLAIFDVFDEWFHQDDFEGCSFINILLETGDLDHPVGNASAAHLEYIRSVVRGLAEEAGMDGPDAESFAHSWHILMKGSIVAAGEGDSTAARRARSMGQLLLDHHLGPDADSPPPVH
jgi:AcrR family transcriptional regulator